MYGVSVLIILNNECAYNFADIREFRILFEEVRNYFHCIVAVYHDILLYRLMKKMLRMSTPSTPVRKGLRAIAILKLEQKMHNLL